MARQNIPTEQLLAYAAGDLEGPERADVEARLANDPDAQAMIRLYQSAQVAMSTDDSVAPPTDAVARAKAVYTAPQREKTMRWLEKAQQLVAQLVFDSRTQPALAGIRSFSNSCSLVFETEHESIDVQAEPTRNADGCITGWQIVGQVAQDDDARACPVAFLRTDDQSVAANAMLDERGVFTLDVKPGMYEIRIGLPRHTIILPSLDLS